MVTKRGHEHRRRPLGWLAGGVLGALSIVAATPAVAADGQWWYDVYAVADAHAAGWTGEGVKIAVIDAQINPDLPDFEGADLSVAPGAACEGSTPTTTEPTSDAEHGSTVTAMLIGNGTGVAGTRGIVPDASVTFYGLGTLEDCEPVAEVTESDLVPMAWMIRRALDDGADIITTSIVVGDWSVKYDDPVMLDALVKKVPVVAGNPNFVFSEGSYPSMLNGVTAVGGVDIDGNLPEGSLGVENKVIFTSILAPGVDIATIGDGSGSWDVAGRGSGSSLATPLVAGILAAAAQKYPDASGNQLLQSLAHNTGPEPHELSYDESGSGFGYASLRRVLEADPLQYDDVNPMLNKDLAPSVEDVEAAAAAAASPAPSDDPASPDVASVVPIVIGVGAVVLILIIAAVIVTVVLVRRSNRNHQRGQS